MARQLPTDDTEKLRPPLPKSVLKKQAKNAAKNAKKRERSNKVAKAALTDFEGHKVHSVGHQHRGLFNSKYQRLAGIHASIGQAETAAAKTTGKKKGKKKKEDLVSSAWSIDYKQFEMPGNASGSGGVFNSQYEQSTAEVPQARHLPRPPHVVRESLASGPYSEISDEDNEHNLREYDIGSSLVLSTGEFPDQIPVSNIDDLNDLAGSADPAITFSDVQSRALESTIEYLESVGEGINDSAGSSTSAMVTFNGTLPKNVQGHHYKTEPKDKELNFTPRGLAIPSAEPIYAKINKTTKSGNSESNQKKLPSETQSDTEREIDAPVTSIDDLVDMQDFPTSPSQFRSPVDVRSNAGSNRSIELSIRHSNSLINESTLTTMQDMDGDVAL